ncbi:hypothetical protein I3217_04860 [Formosa sp. S-31]
MSGNGFLGGEIINPNTRYVTISKDNTILDTVMLDQNNRFLYKITPVNPGLYTFAHGGEIQMVFLEPNDSIMFRLNTIDFDESLVYTGIGAKENNYLINMFVESERINHNILKLSQSSPEVFEKKLDSIKAEQTRKLNEFNIRYKTSPLFQKFAQANIDYNYYAQKEIYPFTYYGNNELKNLESLPKDFYNYRKQINYNDITLKDYFPYYTFLKYHFNNMALQKHFKHSQDSIFNRRSLDYNLDKLQLIDSLVQNDSIKNYFLNYSAIRYIGNSNKLEDYDTYLDTFLKLSTSSENNNSISSMVESLKRLKPGSTVPNTLVTNNEDEELHLHDFITRPTVIYFWSSSLKDHFVGSHKKVQELKLKYPEIDFIAMNIDKNEEQWIDYLQEYKYPIQNEYHFKNPEVSRQILALNSIYRVVLVNKDKKIISSNSNLFSKYFEEELLGMLNQ